MIKSGFTLIELMVVLVIIGILATLAIPKFYANQKKTVAVECKPFLKEIYTLQEAYKMGNTSYAPATATLGYEPLPGSSFKYEHSDDNGAVGIAKVSAMGSTKLALAEDIKACITNTAEIKAQPDLAALLASTQSGCP